MPLTLYVKKKIVGFIFSKKNIITYNFLKKNMEWGVKILIFEQINDSYPTDEIFDVIKELFNKIKDQFSFYK